MQETKVFLITIIAVNGGGVVIKGDWRGCNEGGECHCYVFCVEHNNLLQLSYVLLQLVLQIVQVFLLIIICRTHVNAVFKGFDGVRKIFLLWLKWLWIWLRWLTLTKVWLFPLVTSSHFHNAGSELLIILTANMRRGKSVFHTKILCTELNHF